MSTVGRKRQPVRVLHLRDSPWVDGPGRTLLETATRIDRRRVDYQVGAFVSDPRQAHPLVAALQARNLPVHTVLDRGGARADLVKAIITLVDELSIEVLHTSEFRSNVLALLCRLRRPIRIVTTAHGWIANDLRGRVYTLTDRVLLRQFDRVILVSHAMRQRLPRWWVPDRRLRILHNALMVDSYGGEDTRRARRSCDPQGEVRVLNVGRLSPEKGQDRLLHAVARLKLDYPGIRLAFAGTGPMEGRLKQLAADLNIAEQVSFLGYVNDMPALYSETDLVVQSSFTEGLPNVMLEVAFLGVPVVATAVGGTAEVIRHKESGWLVEPRSEDALEAGIRAFLQRPLMFAEMARSGRRIIEEDFTFEARTEIQMKLYEECSREVS